MDCRIDDTGVAVDFGDGAASTTQINITAQSKFTRKTFQMRVTGLLPVIDSATRVIIVGTFPSEISLQMQQYYANPANHFWKIISSIFNLDFILLPYQQRIAALLQKQIGLWDAIESCKRCGSMDKKIREAKPNNFSKIQQHTPELRIIAYNGKKAEQYSSIPAHTSTTILPSTSPANTHLNFDAKVDTWRKHLQYMLR